MSEPRQFPNLAELKSLGGAQLSRHLTLYEGYVRALNAIDDRLEALTDRPCDPSFSERSELLRRRPFAYNAKVLHELFFEQLGINTGAEEPLDERIQHYGGYDKVIADLAAVSLCGVGWSLLVHDTTNDTLHVTFVGEHHIGHLLGHDVLIAHDAWEHAFIEDYGLDRARYARAVLNELDWGVVSARLIVRQPAPPPLTRKKMKP